MSGRLIPRQAHIRTAAAIMIRFNQCMSVLIFATRIFISIRQASRSSLSMFSPPLILLWIRLLYLKDKVVEVYLRV